MAKLFIASLVDPASHPGGAGTYTRGLLAALGSSHVVNLAAPLHPPPGPWYRSRQIMSLARSYISELPALTLFTRQPEFKLRIRKIARSQHFDAALINGGDMLWAVKELPPEIPTVLIAHNLEHQVLTQKLANYPFLSHVLKREIIKQRRYEIEGFRRSRGVIFLSAAEMAWGCNQVPGLRALHVPPMFTDPPIVRQPKPNGHLRLGFLADFAWWPNRQSWKWLMDKILPKVCRPITVHVFGRQSDQIPTHGRIISHGFVQNLREVWEQVDIMICPIHEGAGVNIKLAESLYNRMPVLATTLAVRGLECPSGPGLTIMDSADEWVAFLSSSQADLLAAEVPSEELSRQFSPDRHREKLENFLTEVIRGNPR
ncbi:glycosyltransferase [Nitrospira sp. T9]|uniref:glycosyltransferase n=1 Tax=unclassified Nitrospira TaxID=2652172 RepID=UPI003F96C611